MQKEKNNLHELIQIRNENLLLLVVVVVVLRYLLRQCEK
mgnify:CR=1 FL=1